MRPNRARGTGEMTGSDGGNRLSMADWPGTFPCSVTAALGITSPPRDGGVYIDGTFGAGGYTRAMLAAADCRVIGIDRDQSAIARGVGSGRERRKAGSSWCEDRFSASTTWRAAQGHEAVDGVVLDIGVSSMQLDEAERGFSFR